MDAPKISVLVPAYNRKHYIADCINSVLIQTFRGFEILICDDGSNDGSAEFITKNFSKEISSGKIKLLRNEKNIGEFPTDNRLIRAATGKYIMILHSDDLYLHQALEQMYETAEYFNADVVHAGTFLQSPADGVINSETQFKVMCWENRLVRNFEVVPNEPSLRFNEWGNVDTFFDAQYNIFRRKFILDNEIFFPDWGGNYLFCLHWLMKAKKYVKTPDIFYINRNSPDSLTNKKVDISKHARKIIFYMNDLMKYLDQIFQSVEFFKDNEVAQYRAKAIFFNCFDDFEFTRLKIYEQGVTPEIHNAVDGAIKEIFGERADYVTFLFHKVHCLPFEQDYNKINSSL